MEHRRHLAGVKRILVVILAGSLARHAPAATRVPDDAIGGGWANGGIRGAYYDRPLPLGRPAFTRNDVRIDFHRSGLPGTGDLGDLTRPGSSVRWTGVLLPRFSETYHFLAQADGPIALRIRARKAKRWQPLFERAAGPAEGKAALKAGQSYEVEIVYRHTAGATAVALRWNSPSTPNEVIETASPLGVTVTNEGFADAMRTASDDWRTPDFQQPVRRDAEGWPLADAACVVWQGSPRRYGTYRLQFLGRARVSTVGGYGTVGGVHYDPATNTSTANLVISSATPDTLALRFLSTHRTAGAPAGSGIRKVRLLCPASPGSGSPLPASTLFAPAYLGVLEPLSVLRVVSGAGAPGTWEARTRPGYATQCRPDRGEGASLSLELAVALANRAGKDLCVQLPLAADEIYVARLARAVRYGSNGDRPYEKPTAAPIYPPLNSNLRLYVEVTGDLKADSETAQQMEREQTREAGILGFDGATSPEELAQRLCALRAVRASMVLRRVFGDGAMGRQVRVVLRWRDGAAVTAAAAQMLFLDRYFNNGDGARHVAQPHPPHYYAWGAGVDTRFSAGNLYGVTDLIRRGTFESPLVADRLTAPEEDGWLYTGTAGVARMGASLGLPRVPRRPGETGPTANAQAAYVQGAGSVGLRLAMPADAKSRFYAVMFEAAQGSGPDPQAVDVYADSVRINCADTPAGFYLPTTRWQTYFTRGFLADPGSVHTLRFGGISPKPAAAAGVDNVVLCSVDALFAGEMPVPAAGGTAAEYARRITAEANWAGIYGLRLMSVEGGWDVGGEEPLPLQTLAKYGDARAADAQQKAIDVFLGAGGTLPLVSAYGLWDAAPDAPREPLYRGAGTLAARLPAGAQGGVPAGTALTAANRIVELGGAGSSTQTRRVLQAEPMFAWAIQAPRAGAYLLRLDADGGVRASVDGVLLPPGRTVWSAALTPGRHVLRAWDPRGQALVRGIGVQPPAGPKKAKPNAAPGPQTAANAASPGR